MNHQTNQYEDYLLSALNAVERDPQSAHAHNSLGIVYYLLERAEDAIAAFERSIELDPNFADPYNGLGAIYFQNWQTEAAIAALEKAVDLKPGDDVMQVNLGNLYRHLGRTDAAMTAFKNTLDLNSQNASAYLGLAAIEYDSGQHEHFDTYITQARECLRREDYYDHALLASLTGDIDEAFEYLSKLPNQERNHVQTDPAFKTLRDDPRFQKLVGMDVDQ